MQRARLFTNGRSQAVRLPKDFRFRGKAVFIRKFHGVVMLVAPQDPWASLIRSLDAFSEDFLAKRNQPPQQSRPRR